MEHTRRLCCALLSQIRAALPRFIELLTERLTDGVPTTEDSVRYLFFASMLDQGFDPNRIVLEYPHPVVGRARVDTVVLDPSGLPVVAIEFKYDRAGPGGHNQPRPMKAGAALADLTRLHQLTLAERWFVHLLDREMTAYLSSPRNGLSRIWNVPDAGARVSVRSEDLIGLSDTLRNRAGAWPVEVLLEQEAFAELPGHRLVVFRVS